MKHPNQLASINIFSLLTCMDTHTNVYCKGIELNCLICFITLDLYALQNDKRERVVKASRDITMNSKKVIFQVHR